MIFSRQEAEDLTEAEGTGAQAAASLNCTVQSPTFPPLQLQDHGSDEKALYIPSS